MKQNSILFGGENVAMKNRVRLLLSRVKLECLSKSFDIIIETDKINGSRVYIQLGYWSRCCKTGNEENWKSRKWYLSEFMTDDEIIKTCYSAFRMCIEHEILEGFKVDGKILFNPHINFEKLLEISTEEVVRNSI